MLKLLHNCSHLTHFQKYPTSTNVAKTHKVKCILKFKMKFKYLQMDLRNAKKWKEAFYFFRLFKICFLYIGFSIFTANTL